MVAVALLTTRTAKGLSKGPGCLRCLRIRSGAMRFFSSGVCRATGIRPSSERRVRQPVVCRQRYHTLQQRVVGDEPLISNMTPNVSLIAGFSRMAGDVMENSLEPPGSSPHESYISSVPRSCTRRNDGLGRCGRRIGT